MKTSIGNLLVLTFASVAAFGQDSRPHAKFDGASGADLQRRALAALKADFDLIPDAIDVLMSMPEAREPLVEGLTRLLEVRDFADAFLIRRALDKSNYVVRESPEALVDDLVRSPNRSRRLYAAWALGRIGQRAAPALPALIETARRSEGRLRVYAVRAIAVIASPADDEIELLIGMLNSFDERCANELPHMAPDPSEWELCGAVIEALGMIGPRGVRAVPLLESRARALHYMPPNIQRALDRIRCDFGAIVRLVEERKDSIGPLSNDRKTSSDETARTPRPQRAILLHDGSYSFAVGRDEDEMAFGGDWVEINLRRNPSGKVVARASAWWFTDYGPPLSGRHDFAVSGKIVMSAADWSVAERLKGRCDLRFGEGSSHAAFVIDNPFRATAHSQPTSAPADTPQSEPAR